MKKSPWLQFVEKGSGWMKIIRFIEEDQSEVISFTQDSLFFLSQTASAAKEATPFNYCDVESFSLPRHTASRCRR